MNTLRWLLLLVFAASASANLIRHKVERSSELERELGYRLSVEQESPARGYVVRFQAAAAGELKDIFALDLSLADDSGMLARVPLETRSKFTDDLAALRSQRKQADLTEPAVREISVEFLIKKELIGGAVLMIRCGTGLSEESYEIHLKDYVSEA